MTRDEWIAYIQSKPLTGYQRGAIMRQCDRLGLADRTERLAVLAALVGLDALGSTADLTQGQGGYLVSLLQRTRDRNELPAVSVVATAADGGDQLEHVNDDDGLDLGDMENDDAEPVSVLDAIERFLLMFAIAVYGRDRGSHEGIATAVLSDTKYRRS